MKIAIVTKYENMHIYFNTWANEQDYINWRKDFYEGTRCTVAYAASELKSFLKPIINNAEIYFSTVADGDINIHLISESEEGRSGIYSLVPCEKGVKIIGKDRVGVLYGAYELLKLQGYRWFTSGGYGNSYVPAKTDTIILPEKEQYFAPAMDIMRGFDFEGLGPGLAMWKWMARNRLNGARPQAGLEGWQNKLGMILKEGGHFFNSFLSPECVLPTGKTVWEEHPEWYGVREDGTPVTPQNALLTQFCVSNDEVCKYFADEVVRRLKNEWYSADRVDIWGFDTWGSTCCCEKCKSLGNSTDQTLYMLSKVREAIDEANLDRKVELVLCSYGGTSTLEPPSKPIPDNIIKGGDMITFYPITRCYRHRFDEKPCHENEYFDKCLKGWLQKKPAMPIIMGEYYVLSKWEEMPVVLTGVMCDDIPKYIEMGIGGITYMHMPLCNWGVKASIQWIYSNLSWDPSMDKEELMNDYYEKRYHENAEGMQKVYDKLEKAFDDVQTWRSWAPESVLSQLLVWNGSIPTKEFETRNHYANNEELIARGKEILRLLNECVEEIKEMKKFYFTSHPVVDKIKLAMNPCDLTGLRMPDAEEFKLGEALRAILYAIDVMTLMVAMVEYHDALYHGKPHDEFWATIEKTYDKLDSYYTIADRGTFFEGGDTRTALDRSQLGRAVRVCAAYRKNVLGC